jgi:hypothetical protein
VTIEVAGAPNRSPALELHLGRYDRRPVEIEVERRIPSAPDLLAELSMARAHGRALVGAAPHEVRQYQHDPAGVIDEHGIADLLDTVLAETARIR